MAGVERYVGSGIDPTWLVPAVITVQQHGAKLFAETTDRFIRNPNFYSSKYPDAQARDADLYWLRCCTEKVTLITDLHPDASPSEVKAYHSKRGQECKGLPGGRPKKYPRGKYHSRATNSDLAKVATLREGGKSIREIARIFDRSSSTIQGWLRKSQVYEFPTQAQQTTP